MATEKYVIAQPQMGGGHPVQSARLVHEATESFCPIVARIDRVARSVATVLIIGETGTGKELVARAIHDASDRAGGPFICLNIAAVPSDLAEAMLFGHERGAFTGATHSSLGYCRRAQHGTLFLDEIGEADLALQAKLLRFIEYGEIQPVGASNSHFVDVRIVAATNRNLANEVMARRFRDDLLYRLTSVSLQLPPLRERRTDISRLIDSFLRELNERYDRNCSLSDALRMYLISATWPGNVRQLKAVIEGLVLLCSDEIIDSGHLTPETATQIGLTPLESAASGEEAPSSVLDRVTRAAIVAVLGESGGNVREAAQRLGVGRSTLYRWLKRAT